MCARPCGWVVHRGTGALIKQKTHQQTMKKLYTQPLVEQEELFVEAGIAQSGVYEDILIDEGGNAGLLDENIW